jgi:peptidoglycan-associated lipoprotein
MKLNSFGTALILAVALTLAVTGCKGSKPGVTPLPNGGMTGGGKSGEPGAGGKIGEGTGITDADAIAHGLPAGPGHPDWPQNREILQADTVHFDYDSALIRASEKSKVTAVADYLKANSANAVLIEGHCDERGTEEYNRALGERRALALREEVARAGIDPNRVDTVSFGRNRPANTGHSEAAHASNRRGEFVVLTPK